MPKITRQWDILSKGRRDNLVREIITYFKEELDKEIGILAAEDILDFFLKSLWKDIYNKALDDSKTTIKQNLDNLEIDLDLLLGK